MPLRKRNKSPPNHSLDMESRPEPSNPYAGSNSGLSSTHTEDTAGNGLDVGGQSPPPDYNPLQRNVSNFVIDTVFIRAALKSSEVRYHLSSTVHTDISELRIRRLSSTESRSIATTSQLVSFLSSDTLYTITRPPFEPSIMIIKGSRKSTLPGTIQMRHRLRKWKVEQEHCGKIFQLFQLSERTRSRSLQWKGEDGTLLADDVWENEGTPVERPMLKLSQSIKLSTQELLITCWIARIWYFTTKPMLYPMHTKD
ncbi:hypothetical protein M501DRAFT_1013094 [Patellaria atrata CBS 101060]|uniref:Uncharacterized protein n=1 Tax=Patellaria atrata CBS 101060 TaxID=1346257 RepID=A0A9P4SJC5_9PEZI|nr:hypothetical protein M501DRAFT_1013094 [Patellaria atrata CBS 101060]